MKLPAILSNVNSVIPFRQRYLLTRANRLRLRYSVSSVAAACVLVSLFSFSMSGGDVDVYQSNAPLKYSEYTGANITDEEILAPISRLSLNNLIKADSKNAPEYPKRKQLEIGSGQTVAGVLQGNGIDGGQAHSIVQAMSEYIDMRKVRAGQDFEIIFDRPDTDSDAPKLVEVSMAMDPIKSVHVTMDDQGQYAAELKEKEVFTRQYVGETEIQTSLYGSAARSGIPAPVIARMIKIYSWAVDFQRDIRAHDKIQVMYEVKETADGDSVAYGNILYANLNLGGIDLSLYRFEKDDGSVDYYDLKGRSIRKTLMKTPVDGARISSGFGMRHHPVLGYNKMHKGMDFAAPTGTPIYAAGDGKIDKIGRNGGYGNYIRIRHNGSLKTAYAHMSRFAKGMSNGKFVKQGDVIGYIGTTGRSTGPHLHYEVLLDGKQVNPNRVDLPTGENLKGKELERFKSVMQGFSQQYVQLMKGGKYASLHSEDKDKKGSS